MVKRTISALLWLYTGWYAGATLAVYAGTPELLGPVVGMAAALVVGGDPRGVIWKPREAAPARVPAGATEPA